MKSIDKIQEVKSYVGSMGYENIVGVNVYTDNLTESSVLIEFFIRVSKDTLQEDKDKIESILDKRFEDCSFTVASSDTSFRPGIEA